MKRLFLFVLLTASLCIYSQENKSRAESMIAMAMQKEAEGGTPEEFNFMFEQAVKISPEYPELYAMWGMVTMKYMERHKDTDLHEEVFDKFRKAIDLKPSYADAYALWGISLAHYAADEKNDSLYDESFRKFSKAIELDEKNVTTNLAWGRALIDRAKLKKDVKSLNESIKKFDEVLTQDKNSMPAWRDKAYAYLNLGRYEKDFKKYRELFENSCQRAEQLGSQSAAYNMACFYAMIKEKDEAFKWLEKSMLKKYPSQMLNFTKDKMESDKDLDNIRKDNRYKEFIDRYMGG